MSKHTDVNSRWWYGPAATVTAGIVVLVAVVMNMAVGGEQWSAWFATLALYGAFAIGYISLIPMYLDVRKVRTATEYAPRYWLYAAGALLMSPILSSAVYIYNRRKHVA